MMDFGEEISTLDLDLPLNLNPEDALKFSEAFKEFCELDTGLLLISVNVS